MSVWKEYATTALLGAGKAPPPALPEPLKTALTAALTGAALSGEVQFFTQAGALAFWRRAGWKPARNETALPPCPAETTQPLHRASSDHLRAMLGGTWAAVLPEWLEAAARAGRYAPPELLPALLALARKDRALRPLAMAAGGRRAEWLASRNPEWSFASVEPPDIWETGSRDQRVAWLWALRATDPAEARAKVDAVWKTEPAEIRAAFVDALEAGLSEDDAVFLESALDDRSKEVRRAATDLLARMPGAPFAARMIARASPLLAYQPGKLLRRASFEVSLPPDPDAAATRDGLDAKLFGSQKKLGEKAALLAQILAATPLNHWTETFQAEPAALLKALEKNEFARAVATGWALAALRQRDSAWAEALLDGPIKPHPEFLPGGSLRALLSEKARSDRLAGQIKSGAMQKAGSEEWRDCLAQLTELGPAAPPPLVRAALIALRASVADGVAWNFRSSIEAWFLRLPQALLADAAWGWPADQEGVSGLIDLLTFRHESLKALTRT